MNQRRTRQVAAAAAGFLGEGEWIQGATLAKVGSVSVKRRVLTTALVGVLSAGIIMATVHPRAMFCVLTDRRIIFFDGATGKPGKMLMSLPLSHISVSPLSKALLGFGLKTMVTVEGEEKALKLGFPPIAKSDGRRFYGLLPIS